MIKGLLYMKRIFGILLLLCLIFVISACSDDKSANSSDSKSESSSGELKVGLLYPLSGSLALLGNESLNGIELVADYVNENGGVNGDPIKLVKADAPDATAAQNEANRLIDKEKVPVIMGTYSSGLSIAASQVAERNDTLYIETNAVADEITSRGFDNVFRIADSASIQGYKSTEFVDEYLSSELGIDSADLDVVILHEESSFGTAVAEAVQEKADEYNFNIKSIDSYDSATNDLSSVIHKYKDLDPDVVFVTSYINDAILFIQQSKQLQFEPKAIIGSSGGYALSDFGDSLGSDANGIFVTDAPSNPNEEALTEDAKELQELYSGLWEEKYNTPLTGQTWRVINAAHILFTEILPQVDEYTTENIREVLANVDIETGNLPNGTGVKFNEVDGQPGQNSRADDIIMQWQDEEFNLVWPEEFAETDVDYIPFSFEK